MNLDDMVDVVSLKEAGKEDESKIGPKAHLLAGIAGHAPVADGFVVSNDVFKRMISSHREQIIRILENEELEDGDKAAEIQVYIDQGADLIVTTSQLRFDPGIPVISGLPFLTGVGKDKVLDDILKRLKA